MTDVSPENREIRRKKFKKYHKLLAMSWKEYNDPIRKQKPIVKRVKRMLKKEIFLRNKFRWKINELCRLSYGRRKYDGKIFNRVLRIESINMYNKLTGEVQMTLKDDKTGEEFNSAYEKHRFKV